MPTYSRGLRVVPSFARNPYRVRRPCGSQYQRLCKQYTSYARDTVPKAEQTIAFRYPGPPRDAWIGFFKLGFNMCALYWIWRISKQFIRVDIETATSKTSKKPGKTDQASKEGEAIEQQQHEDTEETESDEIVIPETLSEDAVFVSLSIPKQKEAGRYANDDPDWQQITQWATDPKAQQQVKKDILVSTLKHVARHKPFGQKLGQNLTVLKGWIDIMPTQSLPREYERYGLELSDDALYTIYRPMSEQEYSHVINTIWPVSMAQACLAFGRTLYRIEKNRIKKSYEDFRKGDSEGDTPPEVLKAPPVLNFGGVQSPSHQAEQQKAPTATAASTSASKSTEEKKSNIIYTPLDILRAATTKLLAPGSDLSRASRAFQHRMLHNFSVMDFGQNRGDIYLEGWIQIGGTEGNAKYEVRGFLNAKTRQVRMGTKELWSATRRPG